MARLTAFNIGSSFPIRLEKWTQTKKANGSLGDTYVRDFTAYANVDNISSLRGYSNGLNEDETFEMIVRNKALDGRDVDVLWKVKYQGKRLTVKDKVCINKASSDFLLIVHAK